MRIAEALFVLLDTETSGVNLTDDTLEIAARHVTYAPGEAASGRVWARFQTLVRPTGPIPAAASAIHHLVDADFVDAPELDRALDALVAFVPRHAIVVAHHAAFDRNAVAPALASASWLCTMRLARHVVPQAGSFGNAALFYGLELGRVAGALHRADADLDLTQRVLAALLARYIAAGHPDDINALLGLAAKPYQLDTLPFGKHKDQPLAQIPTGYLEWALKPGGIDDPDIRWNLEREIARRRGAAA